MTSFAQNSAHMADVTSRYRALLSAIQEVDTRVRAIGEADVNDSIYVNGREFATGAPLDGAHVFADRPVPYHEFASVAECEWLGHHRRVLRTLRVQRDLLQKGQDNDQAP